MNPNIGGTISASLFGLAGKLVKLETCSDRITVESVITHTPRWMAQAKVSENSTAGFESASEPTCFSQLPR